VVRNILAAIGGYVVMILVVFVGIGSAWMILGASGAFAGESPTPSSAWMVGNLVSGFMAAVAGGWAARRVGTSSASVRILIGLVLVLGVVSLLLSQGASVQALDKPVADLTFMEAGSYAVQPAWYNWVIRSWAPSACGSAVGRRRPPDAIP
jgi:hypothetical protein